MHLHIVGSSCFEGTMESYALH